MFFEFLVLGAEVFYAFLEFFGFAGEGPGEVVELAEASGGEVVGVLAGDGFDAAGTGGDGGLGGDFEVVDFSGGLDAGAAAEFLLQPPRSTITTLPYLSPKKATTPSGFSA